MLHSAYTFAHAFEASLARHIFSTLALDTKSRVLDPFCGTGTTLLECKIHGLASIGVDANPVCVLVSRAKTDWTLDVPKTRKLAQLVTQSASRRYQAYVARHCKAKAAGAKYTAQSDPLFTMSAAGRYLISSGLIRRGWISPRPALKALLIAQRLWNVPPREKNFLFLSLLGLLVPVISNMAYGPEIYRARRRIDCQVFDLFLKRTYENLITLDTLRSHHVGAGTTVRFGDSANDGLNFLQHSSIDAVITSPPYLSDHDYSRLTRLELVFSGHLSHREDLRRIKMPLLRSSSKNVYKSDNLSQLVKRFSKVQQAINAVSMRASGRTSGFARVYPRLVGEYFGGMYAHLRALSRVVRLNGRVALVVADQSSFFAIPIRTASIIAELAEGCKGGFRLLAMERVRKYRGTRGAANRSNDEWLIMLEKRSRTA